MSTPSAPTPSAVTDEQIRAERAAFELHYRHLDRRTETVYGGNFRGTRFIHAHVESLWCGWKDRAVLALAAPAESIPATSMPCEDCNGTGEVGDEIPQGEFQPPERERCDSCDGSGRWSIDAAQPASNSAPEPWRGIMSLNECAEAEGASSSAPAVGGVAPCPFCGGTKISAAEGSTFRWWVASCNECGACAGQARRQTLGDGTNAEWDAAAKADAFKEWNTRAAPAGAAGQDAALLRQALEALESCGSAAMEDGGQQWFDDKLVDAAHEAITAALAATPPTERDSAPKATPIDSARSQGMGQRRTDE